MMKYIHDIAHCDNECCIAHNDCYRYNAYQEIKGSDYMVTLYIPEDPFVMKCKLLIKDDIKDESTKETE